MIVTKHWERLEARGKEGWAAVIKAIYVDWQSLLREATFTLTTVILYMLTDSLPREALFTTTLT